MITRITFALLLLLAPASAQDAERGYVLRLNEAGWGDSSPKDITAVLYSSCDAIFEHLPGVKLEEVIRVRRDDSGPIVLYRRNARGEVVVELDTGDRFWCQYAYQMAHEFCHILCDFRDGSKRNLWFEESLCELASIFALRSMTESWKTDPPYPNWKGYSTSLRDYAADLEEKHQLPEGLNLAKFYAENAGVLAAEPTDRDVNGTIALALLPLFEATPQHWPALRSLNAAKGKDDIPFDQYLKNWHDQAPEKHREFIKSIASQFGITW